MGLGCMSGLPRKLTSAKLKMSGIKSMNSEVNIKNREEKTQQQKSFEINLLKNSRIQFTTHTTLKGVSPNQAYDFLINMDNEKYRLFHPEGHKEYKVLHRPEKGTTGTVVYLKEVYENGFISSAKAVITEADPGRRIIMKSISPWWNPGTLIFILEAGDNGTVITHHLQIGSALPVLGFIYNKLVKLFFLSEKNTAAIYKHVKEEYRNLEKILGNRK